MRINRKLNLVIPVDTTRGTVYVHSTPISRDVFEKYFLVIAKTFSALYRERLDVMVGPRVAMMMLRQTAEGLGVWDGQDGVRDGLVGEINRLTNVAVSGPRGWTTIPYEDAINQKLLDEDDVAEVGNAIVFFTCNSVVHSEANLTGVFAGMSLLWGAQTTSLTCTEFANSLPISIGTASSGAQPKPPAQTTEETEAPVEGKRIPM